MNPADLIRKGVAKLNDWFEKTEREELEQRREIAKGNPLEESPPGRQSAGRKGEELGKPSAEPAGIAEIIPASRSHRTPCPDATTTQGGRSERPSGETELLIASRGGETYREKNRLVQQISNTYSAYGDQVASAVLQKCLMPDGVQLLATKLGMDPIGDDDLDHNQIVDYLRTKGTTAFCEAVGIRLATPVPSRGGLARSRGNEEDRHGPVGGEKVRMAQNMSAHGKVEADSPVMKMSQTGVIPVDLASSSEGTETIKSPTPAPPVQRADRNRVSSTPPLPVPAAQRPLQSSRLSERPLTPVPIHAPGPKPEAASSRAQPASQSTPPAPPTPQPAPMQPVSLRGDATPHGAMTSPARSASDTGHPASDPRVPTPGPDDPLRATPLPRRDLAKRDPANEDTGERRAADFLRDELDDDQ